MSDPLNKAAAIIRDRARQDPRFVAAIDATIKEVWAMDLFALDVDEMRALGGFTKIIVAAFERHMPADAFIPGSKLFGPYPLRSAFSAADVADIRLNVQLGRLRSTT